MMSEPVGRGDKSMGAIEDLDRNLKSEKRRLNEEKRKLKADQLKQKKEV